MKFDTYVRRKLPALFLSAALVLGGCGSANTDAFSANTESLSTQNEAVISQTFEVDQSIYMDSSAPIEDRVAALLAQMTLEEKVAQMVQAEQASITPEEVTAYGIGSVLSGGGSAPSTGNTPRDWQARVNDLVSASLESRLSIPLLYGIDAVHGNNNIYGATVFPHNIGLGAANDTELMEEIGTVVGEEVRAVGIPWTFAPTLGNPMNVTWGRTYECFSERPEDIAPLAFAYVEGLQGSLNKNDYMDQEHVIACAKHFIGEGYTTDGINQGNVDMTPEEFDELLANGVLDPYTSALNAGVLTVMASYNSVDGVKCHENKHLLTDVLKNELGFTGFVVSDYNAIEQTSGATYKDQVELCVNAGIDMFMEPNTWKECMETLLELVAEGRVTEERINDAVTRILRVKFTAGLFDTEPNNTTEQELFSSFGSDEHREVARRAVRESLVLLKNDPVGDETALSALSSSKNIAVVGQKAYDIGSQCGGWTITWQGKAGKITQGTTLIEGFDQAVDSDVALSHSLDASNCEGADAVIAVFGETPYAETDGDRTGSTLNICSSDCQSLDALRENLTVLPEDAPVIGIIIAGRPINISEYEDMFDAIIMAWLPGTEGDGVADVLFGDYDFTGTLKYTWMKDMNDIGSKDTADADKILYPYGYGLKK